MFERGLVHRLNQPMNLTTQPARACDVINVGIYRRRSAHIEWVCTLYVRSLHGYCKIMKFRHAIFIFKLWFTPEFCVNSGLTGDYSSVKFHWGLTVDLSLAGVGEINLLLTGEVNWWIEFTCVGETRPKPNWQNSWQFLTRVKRTHSRPARRMQMWHIATDFTCSAFHALDTWVRCAKMDKPMKMPFGGHIV